MTSLTDLGLTPSQYAEVEQLDHELVDAWLEELDSQRSTVRTPVAWFLKAIRTGLKPNATLDPRRQQQIRNAENWIRNVGHCFTDQASVEAHLFDDRGIIRNCADPQLRARLLEMWRKEAMPVTDPQTGLPYGQSAAEEPVTTGTNAEDAQQASLKDPVAALTIPEDAGPPDDTDWP